MRLTFTIVVLNLNKSHSSLMIYSKNSIFKDYVKTKTTVYLLITITTF